MVSKVGVTQAQIPTGKTAADMTKDLATNQLTKTKVTAAYAGAVVKAIAEMKKEGKTVSNAAETAAKDTNNAPTFTKDATQETPEAVNTNTGGGASPSNAITAVLSLTSLAFMGAMLF